MIIRGIDSYYKQLRFGANCQQKLPTCILRIYEPKRKDCFRVSRFGRWKQLEDFIIIWCIAFNLPTDFFLSKPVTNRSYKSNKNWYKLRWNRSIWKLLLNLPCDKKRCLNWKLSHLLSLIWSEAVFHTNSTSSGGDKIVTV